MHGALEKSALESTETKMPSKILQKNVKYDEERFVVDLNPVNAQSDNQADNQ